MKSVMKPVMKSASMTSQKGISYWGVMSLIVALVVVGRLALVTAPVYLDNRMLNETIQNKLRDAGNKTGAAVMKDIQKQMRINSTSADNAEDLIEIINGSPGSVKLKTNYEKRANLFAHIDVVSKFEQEFSQ